MATIVGVMTPRLDDTPIFHPHMDTFVTNLAISSRFNAFRGMFWKFHPHKNYIIFLFRFLDLVICMEYSCHYCL